MKHPIVLALTLLTASFAFAAPPASASHVQECVKQLVPCLSEGCLVGQSCLGVRECSAWQVDWYHCEGYLLCVWVEDVGFACLEEPTGCPQLQCVDPIQLPPWLFCADAVPGRECAGDAIACVHLSPTSIPVCARDPCPALGCGIDVPSWPVACAAGVPGHECPGGESACVQPTPRATRTCVTLPCRSGCEIVIDPRALP